MDQHTHLVNYCTQTTQYSMVLFFLIYHYSIAPVLHYSKQLCTLPLFIFYRRLAEWVLRAGLHKR
jgi:hypothetical protein